MVNGADHAAAVFTDRPRDPMLADIYYSPDREALVTGTSGATRQAFKSLFDGLWQQQADK